MLVLTFAVTQVSGKELKEYLLKTGIQNNAAAVILPDRLEVGSSNVLNKTQQDTLLAQYRTAAKMAEIFARENNLTIVRDVLPGRVNMLSSTAEVAEMTKRPEMDRLGLVVARIDLTQGIVYLGRSNTQDLYMELGKWFFYQPQYSWGKDLKADQEHQAMIKAFAVRCMEQKVQLEGQSVASAR
jgi:hypothetical protein